MLANAFSHFSTSSNLTLLLDKEKKNPVKKSVHTPRYSNNTNYIPF